MYYKVVKIKGKLSIVESDSFSAKPKGFQGTYNDNKMAQQHCDLGYSPLTGPPFSLTADGKVKI